MITRGPTLTEDGETPTGSVHIVDLPDSAAARDFASDADLAVAPSRGLVPCPRPVPAPARPCRAGRRRRRTAAARTRSARPGPAIAPGPVRHAGAQCGGGGVAERVRTRAQPGVDDPEVLDVGVPAAPAGRRLWTSAITGLSAAASRSRARRPAGPAPGRRRTLPGSGRWDGRNGPRPPTRSSASCCTERARAAVPSGAAHVAPPIPAGQPCPSRRRPRRHRRARRPARCAPPPLLAELPLFGDEGPGPGVRAMHGHTE